MTDTHEPSEVERDCQWLLEMTDFWESADRVLRVIRAARAYEAEREKREKAEAALSAIPWRALMLDKIEALTEVRDALRARCEKMEKALRDALNDLATVDRASTHWMGCEKDHWRCRLAQRINAALEHSDD